MKKFVSLFLTALLIVSLAAISVSAEDKKPVVFVTVSDEHGMPVLANEEITLEDADGDSKLTASDALLLAHGKACPDGFAYTDAYGEREITSLWGYRGGYYGCFINGVSFYLLTDRLEDGDTVHAFVYRTGEACTDAYCYFSKDALTFENGKDTLTLYAYTLTEEGNLLSVPVKGAVITVNGEKTNIRTDKDGRFTLRTDALTVGEKNVISAVWEDDAIIPPVLTATVAEEDMKNTPGFGAYLIALILLIAALFGVSVILHEKMRKARK